jgi:trk system potassium uptake protein TrkH
MVCFVTANLWLAGHYDSLLSAFRYAAFNVVSVVTTTGYANTDYGLWPYHIGWLMILFSAFATCSGSTGGGIKMIRLVIMFKLASQELTRIVHPRAVAPVSGGADGDLRSACLHALLWGHGHGGEHGPSNHGNG